jgi:mono/diheme cytochrome c family protein
MSLSILSKDYVMIGKPCPLQAHGPVVVGLLALSAAASVTLTGATDTCALAGEPRRATSEGPRLYGKLCARCHSSNGSGEGARDGMPEIPNFRDQAWQDKRSNSQLTIHILDGRGKNMPAFGGKVTPENARALAEHIRTLSHPTAGTTDEPQDEFENRFRKLQADLEDLMRQFRELSDKRNQQTLKKMPIAR